MSKQFQQNSTHPSQCVIEQNVLQSDFQPLIVPVKTASRLLSVCERTVWDLIREGLLPSVRIGSRVLVVYQDILAYIHQNTDTSGKLVRPDRSNSLATLNRSRAKKNFKNDGGAK